MKASEKTRQVMKGEEMQGGGERTTNRDKRRVAYETCGNVILVGNLVGQQKSSCRV